MVRRLISLGAALAVTACAHPFGSGTPDRTEQARQRLLACAEIDDGWARQQCQDRAKEQWRAAERPGRAVDAKGDDDLLHDREVIEGRTGVKIEK